jgi:integrase
MQEDNALRPFRLDGSQLSAGDLQQAAGYTLAGRLLRLRLPVSFVLVAGGASRQCFYRQFQQLRDVGPGYEQVRRHGEFLERPGVPGFAICARNRRTTTLKRAKDQIGSRHKVKRAKGPAVWIWRRRVIDAAGVVRHPAVTVGTVAEMPTKKAAWDLSQEKRTTVLSGEAAGPKFRELVERYQREDTAHLRHSSLSSNKSRIKRVILPLWGDVPLADVKPLAVEQKINELPASKKTKLHIKAMMHKIFNFGLKCEMVTPQPNPMRFVTIHGVMRRVRKKHILSPQQFKKLFRSVDLRMQTMISLATCNGLGASEFLGLQWPDFDFKRGVFSIRRSITGKHLEATKTVAREDEVIMDEKVVSLLLRWKRECRQRPRDGFSRTWMPAAPYTPIHSGLTTCSQQGRQ